MKSQILKSISADQLGVGYSKFPVVENVSVSLEPGALLVLIGTNGSGKSTILKTMAGLLRPIKGYLEILGQPSGMLPKRVAYLPQHPISTHTLPLRVRDVVAMGRFAHLGLFRRTSQHDQNIVIDAMKRTGIETQANEPIRDLSGGQQQRTHLAQVLTRQAEILLLDEPFGHLDANLRTRLTQHLIHLREEENTTIPP